MARATGCAVVAVALAACGDGGGGFSQSDIPDLELSPSDSTRGISDSGLEVGEVTTASVVVENSGLAPLEIDDVRLEYAPPAGATDPEGPAFELVPLASDLPLEVHPLDGDAFPKGVEIQVRYTKQEDGLPREATLVILSDDPDESEVSVTFTTEVGSSRLNTSPQRVDFGLVSKDQVAEETLNILNEGSKTLMVSGFEIRENGRFGVRGDGFEIGGQPDNPLAVDLQEAIPVPPGELKPITVTFLSDSPSPAEGTLRIYSDDPQSGSEGFPVELVANKSGPCIQVDPREISFGGKIVGTPATVEVSILSCGTEPLSIRQIGIDPDSSPDFAAGAPEQGGEELEPPSPASPLVLPINESVTVPVTYVPDEVNPKDPDHIPIPDEGILLVESDAFESRVEVPLEGAGAEQECPEAVIAVEEGEEVIPQTVLHLDGTQSTAAFGSISSYAWTVEQPDGSQETFVPSPTDPQPVFAANVVGLYTFTLRVWDEDNRESCTPATYQVIVQPDQAIHVELTWVTPGDEDETDTGEAVGSDLDLHFAHPSATGPDLDENGAPDPWFDEQWDVFWYNPEPNWGTFDPDADDDPSLDRDDTDGAGPENLNLGEPEQLGEPGYRIGVHYWDSHGFGEADATVKVFTYATEIFSRTVTLQDKDMWWVGCIPWPDAVVQQEPEECAERITENYVNPLFFTP
ncbi:MAG: PKD domain-containing protein [Myxococcota bacterium]